MDNLECWDKLKDVPKQAQKPIKAGRLKGMTDISPQWRYHRMTEVFGPVGIGWKYTIERQWLETGCYEQVCAMTNINLYIKDVDGWSDAIPGTGGSMLTVKESKGPHTSDEAFKMSLTDALSVAMKMLGVGATIYSGGQDYSKYSAPQEVQHETNEHKASSGDKQREADAALYQAGKLFMESTKTYADLEAYWDLSDAAFRKLPEAGYNALEQLYQGRKSEFEAAK